MMDIETSESPSLRGSSGQVETLRTDPSAEDSPPGQTAEALGVEAPVDPASESSLAGPSGQAAGAASAGRLASLLERLSPGQWASVRRTGAELPAADRPIAVIRLARGDGMAVVQARLRAVPQRQAVLVVPGGTRLFRREVDFALLRRCVAVQGLAVALVSHDPRVLTLARRYGFPVSGFVGRAKKKARSFTWQKAEGRRQKAGINYRLSAKRKGGQRASGGWEEWLLLLVLILGAALAGAGGALFVWPQATVTVVPAGGALEQQVQLTADSSIELVDKEAAEIPARLIRTQIKGQAQVSTLARQDAPDAKATGQVVFVNRTSEPVEVRKGTLVATSTGTTIKFATLERATLAAGVGSVAQASIEALDPGLSGNVVPFLINRVADAALALKVRVANEQPTEGGSVRQVGVVTAADKERLHAMLLQQLHQEAYARLESELGPQEFLPVESVSIVVLDETYDHLLGEATDSLGMTMRVWTQGIAFDLTQAQGVARTVLERAVPAGRALRPGSFHAEVVEAAMAVPDTSEEEQWPRVQLVMKARGWTEATITPGRVITLIQGKPIPEATAKLQDTLPLKEPPLLSVEPEWWDRVPWLPFRIRVLVISEEV